MIKALMKPSSEDYYEDYGFGSEKTKGSGTMSSNAIEARLWTLIQQKLLKYPGIQKSKRFDFSNILYNPALDGAGMLEVEDSTYASSFGELGSLNEDAIQPSAQVEELLVEPIDEETLFDDELDVDLDAMDEELFWDEGSKTENTNFQPNLFDRDNEKKTDISLDLLGFTGCAQGIDPDTELISDIISELGLNPDSESPDFDRESDAMLMTS